MTENLVAVEHTIDVCSDNTKHAPHTRVGVWSQKNLFCLGEYVQKRQGEKVYVYVDMACWCQDDDELRRRTEIVFRALATKMIKLFTGKAEVMERRNGAGQCERVAAFRATDFAKTIEDLFDELDDKETM